MDPKCPECGSSKVVNIIYGYMELSDNLKKKLDAGRTRLGDAAFQKIPMSGSATPATTSGGI